MRERLRLGVDVGTSSMGWALFALDGGGSPARLVDAGVRIFSSSRDPESDDPLSKARREARQPRRQRDRRLQRRRRVMNELVRLGLMPANHAERKALETVDPYAVRAKGLAEPLHPHELGRALFHLAQRRGFRSGRLGAASDDGVVRDSIADLRAEMERSGAPTLGAYWRKRLDGGMRVRGAFWTAREMTAAEFDTLVARQVELQPELGPVGRFGHLRGCILHQRPLKEQPVGRCTIDGASPRAPWASPLAQRFRILHELANLRVTVPPEPAPQPLTRDQRDRLCRELSRRKELTFDRMRALLGLEAARFNLESETRDRLKGDQVAALLAHRDLFGKSWHDRPLDQQAAIVERILAAEDADSLARELGLPPAAAERLARLRLPQGHCHLGLPVIRAVLPIMLDQGLDYAAAAAEAGFHHSDFRPDAARDELPYYGELLARWCQPVTGRTAPEAEQRFGRIANPTVHVGLNQLRKLVNAVIARYGKPDEIHVELARGLKLGKARLDELAREQKRNRDRNREADEAMRAAGLDPAAMGGGTLAENRLRYRLWLELGDNPARRCCPYSGRPIGIRALFSADVEVEHILPFARTLDDSPANKTVAYAAANRDKAERSPFGAFKDSPTIDGRRYDWEAIADRATRLPRNKAWRFAADAMARFDDNKGFLDRQLNDTTYLARLTRLYLQALYGREDRVRALPGRLTALLREKWGLNELLAQGNWKNREDHRHHAIDAAVTACTDGDTLQRISRLDERGRARITSPPPFPALREELGARLRGLTVSHKPEHGTAGKLHDEMPFGPTDEVDGNGTPLRVRRRGLDWFTDARKLSSIRDPWLRQAVSAHVQREQGRGVALKDALASFRDPQGKPLRHVRCLEPKNDDALVPIRDRSGRVYKLYPKSGNAWMDVLALPNGKWVGAVMTTFDAQRAAASPAAPPWKAKYPAARRVLRLFKGDLVAVGEGEERRVLRVAQLWDQGTVFLAGHAEGGNLQKRHKSDADPFRWLMPSVSTFPKLRLRKVGVDALGRVRDPGFRP